MNILIAGASGFIGSALVKALSENHTIIVLGRNLKQLERQFPHPIKSLAWEELLQFNPTTVDLVINLAGTNISEKKWTPEVKKDILDSRVSTTIKLLDWLKQYKAAPRFFCANAVGIYGANSGSIDCFDEDTVLNKQPKDFLQEIAFKWEAALKTASSLPIEVTTLRFGVVLKQREGMLKKLELPYKLGLGSMIGAGTQTISWIHYEDVVRAILFLIQHPLLKGAFNLTSPHSVTQAMFSKTFAQVLKRPLFLKLPAFFIRAIFGEMGDCLLLKGQNVYPKRLLDAGFIFQYPTLDKALNAEYNKKAQ